jgi:heptosyltransferase-2
VRSERVLLWLKPHYLGDGVMACPLLDACAQIWHKPAVMAGPNVTEMLWDRRDEVEFVEPLGVSGPSYVWREARRLRAMRFDAVILVNRSFGSALAAWMARVPIRVGHATEGRSGLLTHRVAYPPERFESECYLDLLRSLGVEAECRPPMLLVSAGECSRATTLAPPNAVGIQPGARYPQKKVKLQALAEVARWLHESGHDVVFLGGGDEVVDSVRLQEVAGTPVTDLVGRTSLRQTMAVLATLKLMIGSDTGLMHVAAGVGCPTVTVFAPNPASKWGHAYPPHRVIEAPGGDIAQIDGDTLLRALYEALADACRGSPAAAIAP